MNRRPVTRGFFLKRTLWLLPLSAGFRFGRGAVAAEEPSRESRAVYVPVTVSRARLTPEHTALLLPECERVAVRIGLFAAHRLTPGVLAGEPRAVERARRWMALALNLQPHHPLLRRVQDAWAAGLDPDTGPEPDQLRLFSEFLLRCVKRQRERPDDVSGPALASLFTALAADLDPRNEDAVHEAEIQLRDGNPPPWEALLRELPWEKRPGE